MDGLTAEKSVSVVITQPTSETPRLSLSPNAGFKPLVVEPRISKITSLIVNSVSVDFDGDGNPDYTGNLANIPKWTYQNPGIFQSTLTLNTASGPVSLASTVFVEDATAVRARACVAYAHLKSRLRANDLNGALQALTKSFAYQFKPSALSLGTNLPDFANRIGTIANGILSLTQAELVLVEPNNGVLIGAPMLVTQSADGVWRIDGF
jgi:PKD repeat protein